MITYSKVESIENQMKLNPNGFDPEHNFKNASSNIISSFCLNESYDFGDKEQKEILHWVASFFNNVDKINFATGLCKIMPDFFIRTGLFRKTLTFFKLGSFSLCLMKTKF